MPDTPQVMSVPDAIYHTVHGYPGGVAALAARMGTLTHKANPNNTNHYVRPDELVALQHFSGNVAVLMAMAAALVRFQVEVADLVRAVGEPAERLAESPAAHATGNELRRVEYHAQELSAALAHLVASLRARMRPAPKVEY